MLARTTTAPGFTSDQRRALIQGHFDQLALERITRPLTDEEHDRLISRMARKGL
jgi:hypothetical protein